MHEIEVQFVGSGDAFGSGGRFQTCISVRRANERFLIDCGASSLIAMRRLQINPAEVGKILVTHLHGDHFGGVPFFVLDGQLISKRSSPLTLIGPPGLEERVVDAMEVLFPGSSGAKREFELRFAELQPRTLMSIDGITITGFPVVHHSGAESYALRVDIEGKVIVYSGDTEWTDNLLEATHHADLFICESYLFEKSVRYHLNYRTILQNRDRLTCKRIILTHMSEDVLSRRAEIELPMAEDGLCIVI